MTARLFALEALLLVGACSSQPVLVTPRSFDHPGAVALVCFDTVTEEAVPLASCRDMSTHADLSLHALVAQTGRGEVAAVDLRDDVVIDSDVRVPGYTFVPVGELPTAIVVPTGVEPGGQKWTYVADLGSRDVLAVPTHQFRYRSSGADATRVPLGAAPVALALSPDERTLFVALPDIGQVVRIAIGAAGIEGVLDPISLGSDVPPGVAAEPGPVYCRACLGPLMEGCGDLAEAFPTDASGTRLPLPPREPTLSAAAMPRPTAMAVDADQGVLLVSDAQLPIIHVVDLADPAILHPPITVGVPTLGLALTPAVPAEVGQTDDTKRFLYAIDAVDGSVLAVDYGVGPSGPIGSVLPVETRPGQDADRFHFGASARALQVLTPDYPGGAPCLPGDPVSGDASPDRLRGVFLAVATADGFLNVVDVHDLDAACRGGDSSCDAAPDASDREVYIRRNRLRILARISEGIAIVGTPATSVNDLSLGIDVDGTTEAELAPGLSPLGSCGPGMVDVYPAGEDREPLICTLADPWAAEPEQWRATWEGPIPGTQGALGVLMPGSPPTFEGEVAFCSRGVLGSEDVGPQMPEAAYGGDVLVITGDGIPLSVEGDRRAQCESRFVDETGSLVPIDFSILRAHAGRLELADQTRVHGFTIDEVLECFPELMGFEVRSGEAYTVEGSVSGYMHRVIVDPAAPDPDDGRCLVDTSLDPRRWGHALNDARFDNGIVAFHPRRNATAGSFPGPGDHAGLSFAVGQVPPKFRIDIGALPRSMLFSSVDDRLYTVDIAVRGLLQIPLTPYDEREVRSFR